MPSIRLQKFLSECGVASRRQAEELILEGRVRVNDRVVETLGTKIDPEKDRVSVGRKRVFPKKQGVILFHKPREVVTTLKDPGGRRTVADFLSREEKGFFPVGRLDYHSTGLVILTNDGELSQCLAHPRFEMERIYKVRVAGRLNEKTLKRLERGVKLSDGRAAAQVKIEKEDEKTSWLEVRIAIGRNRVVRRMMEHVGHPVLKLHRTKHGPVSLGKLRSGEMLRLTDAQYARLKDKVLRIAERR